MKFHIEIDCTPEEARRLFGLPDVSRMNEELTQEFQTRIHEAFMGSDSETLVKQWLQTGMSGLEQMQKAFWSGLATGTGQPEAKKPKK